MDHMCQIYGSNATFMDALEGYVGSGLRAGESVVVIARARHLHELEQRLRAAWIDLDRARWEDRFIALLAEETLDKFMVKGWPDEARFRETVTGLIARARGKDNRPVRAFGEMVSVLWNQGRAGATVHLENLWSQIQEEFRFPIFCAYPRDGFEPKTTEASVRTICELHSRVIPSRV